MDTYTHIQNHLTIRNKRIRAGRALEALAWVAVALLLIGGAYIGIKKQDAINQERNVC